jgi:uncharacterized damage-inducible protein DinB
MKSKTKQGSKPAQAGGRGARTAGPFEPARVVAAFLTNERINQVLLDLLEPRIWRLTPPCSQRRNIATTFAHIHNVRCMVLRGAGSKAALANLERATVTPDEARKALAASARAVAEVIERAFEHGGKVRGIPLDAAGFLCSAITHEAHHRGQVCHWARQLGAPIQDQIQLWEWHKRQREIARG